MNTDNITQELLQLKKKIEDAKTQKAECEGALGLLRKQLKDQFNCDTLKQAKSTLHDFQMKVEKLTGEIEFGMKELKDNYEW